MAPKCYHMIDFCPNYIITLVTGADPLEFPTSSPNYLVAGKTPMAEKCLSEVFLITVSAPYSMEFREVHWNLY